VELHALLRAVEEPFQLHRAEAGPVGVAPAGAVEEREDGGAEGAVGAGPGIVCAASDLPPADFAAVLVGGVVARPPLRIGQDLEGLEDRRESLSASPV
jgi:hypothetical protein